MMEVPHYEDRVIKWKLLLPKMQLFCKRLFIMFSTNTIEEKKVTPFSLQPFISVSWFFSFAVWVCVSIQNSKSEQTFATSVLSPLCSCGPWKPSGLNWLRKSYLQICPLSTFKRFSMQFWRVLFKSLAGILSKHFCSTLTSFHSIKLLIMLPLFLISWCKMGTSATRMLYQRWSNNLSYWYLSSLWHHHEATPD